MNLQDYKTNTLARADVDDIVKIEPVEMRPTADKKGYEQVVHTTELGKKLRKYDVHLMRVEDGVKQFVKEHLVVVNEGEADEEVVFTAPTTEKIARTVSRIERYINGLPYLNVEDVQIDGQAKNARFKALKDNGDGTATEVEVYAYVFKANKDTPAVEKHVEIK